MQSQSHACAPKKDEYEATFHARGSSARPSFCSFSRSASLRSRAPRVWQSARSSTPLFVSARGATFARSRIRLTAHSGLGQRRRPPSRCGARWTSGSPEPTYRARGVRPSWSPTSGPNVFLPDTGAPRKSAKKMPVFPTFFLFIQRKRGRSAVWTPVQKKQRKGSRFSVHNSRLAEARVGDGRFGTGINPEWRRRAPQRDESRSTVFRAASARVPLTAFQSPNSQRGQKKVIKSKTDVAKAPAGRCFACLGMHESADRRHVCFSFCLHYASRQKNRV